MKLFFKIGMPIYFLICFLMLGQITVFADEVNPIHEYNFDNDSGTTVIDSGSNKKNGTVTGTEISKLITGYNGVGFARHFERGKKQIVKFGSFSIPNSARSIRLKVRRDGIPTNDSECILSTTNTDGQLSSFIRINGVNISNVENAGKLQIMVMENFVFNCISPTSICDGEWHDILFTYDSKNVNPFCYL